jgi:hypothetical protein
MDRTRAVAAIEDSLGERKLLWLGKRGEDVRSLLAIEQFAGAFTLIAPLRSDAVQALAIETLTGRREDGYDVDRLDSHAAMELRRAMMEACTSPAAIVAYQPYRFLWSPEAEGILSAYLGGGHEDFLKLQSKPLVEQELRKQFGMPCAPWEYLRRSPQRQSLLAAALQAGPLVLRADVSSGGDGFELIRTEEALAASALLAREDEIAWAPYLDHVPLNVSGCVFPDGGVTLHTPSVQLIGMPCCTRWRFGYCGNDFGAIKDLEPDQLLALDRMVRDAGAWLAGRGYVGAFGLDAMVHEGRVVFVEINPRFQGSSRVSAMLDERMGVPDVYLDHVMACLGLDSYETPPLHELARQQGTVSHVTCFNTGKAEATVTATPHVPAQATVSLAPAPEIAVVPGSLLFSLEFGQRVTDDGQSLYPEARSVVEEALRVVFSQTVVADLEGRPLQ